MNKGYKGLYLKEMKRADESEGTVVKLERDVKRLKLERDLLLVAVFSLSSIVSILTVMLFRG